MTYGGRDSGLTDLLDRLPGRPWWWGAGLGLALVVLLVGALHGVGGNRRRLPRPGDNFVESDDPRPPKKPVAQKKEQPPPPAKTASDVAGTKERGNRAAKGSQRALRRPAPAELSRSNDRNLHDPPQVVAEDAVVALVRQGSPESEQIVLRQLTAPPALDCQQEKQPPGVVRQDVVAAAVRLYGSARLRRLLAQAMIDGLPTPAQREVLLSVLCEPNPLNLEAQVTLYQSQSTAPATRVALDLQFVAASSEALQTLLGLTAKLPAAAPPMPDWHDRVGRLLWGPPLTSFLDVEHRALKALADGPGAVALALTIPNHAMRINLRRTLARHWSEGPQTLRAAGVPGAILVEPGLLAVLKSLARENQRAKASVRPAIVHVSRNSHAGGPRPRPSEAPKRAPDSDWDKLTEALVTDYCRRCYLAALVRTAYPTGYSVSRGASTTAPVPPQPGSVIHAAYHVAWPGEHAGDLSPLADDAWRLDYKRIEERTKPSRPILYYRRQLKRCIEHPLPDGMWLDGLTEGGAQQPVQSVDVLITRAGAAAGPPADEEQELTIQILSVDLGSLRQ